MFEAFQKKVNQEIRQHESKLHKLREIRQLLQAMNFASTRIGRTRNGQTQPLRRASKRDRLHWTQRPENKAKVRAMAKKGSRTRLRLLEKAS